ncbi:kif1 [Symbiodinium sp. CCMP2592]|nr:kif1 [Symbiodinium sp. CCMP2592]
MLHVQKITVEVAGEAIPLQQSNGVRQGAPESPVAFGAVVAEDLDAAIRSARPTKPAGDDAPPEDGGSYMDDNYIWSISKKHFQNMLSALHDRLPRRGLFLHPEKTDIISTSDMPTTFQVAGETVSTKGPDHAFYVLGSPLSFQGGTAMLLAEAQTRARKAFWSHRESFTSDATFRQKLQIHVVLVRQRMGNVEQKKPSAEPPGPLAIQSGERSSDGTVYNGGKSKRTGGSQCNQHAQRFNAYMDIDRQLSETVGKGWFTLAQDRAAWAASEAAFIARHDAQHWAPDQQPAQVAWTPSRPPHHQHPAQHLRAYDWDFDPWKNPQDDPPESRSTPASTQAAAASRPPPQQRQPQTAGQDPQEDPPTNDLLQHR